MEPEDLDIEELLIKLNMYKCACAFLVRELGGGEVFIPSEVFDMRGSIMFKIHENDPKQDDGISFKTFVEQHLPVTH